jgi:hypothetical protein
MQVSIKFVEELVVIKQMFGAFGMMQRKGDYMLKTL